MKFVEHLPGTFLGDTHRLLDYPQGFGFCEFVPAVGFARNRKHRKCATLSLWIDQCPRVNQSIDDVAEVVRAKLAELSGLREQIDHDIEHEWISDFFVGVSLTNCFQKGIGGNPLPLQEFEDVVV